MTTWHDTRERAIRSFGGETPNNHTEALCITAFTESAAWFMSTLDQVAADHAAGKIRSGWAILRKRVIDNAALGNPVVDAGPDRAGLVKLAERWINHAGAYVPDEAELNDALFGPHGPLRDHAHDIDLRHRMTELWRTNQPRVEHANADMLERAAAYRRQHAPTDDDLFA